MNKISSATAWLIPVICIWLCACAAREDAQPDAAPPVQAEAQVAPTPSVPDPTPPSGVYKAEAEKAFAEARALWQTKAASLGAVEACSDPEQAVALLDRALKIEPTFTAALVRRGLAKSEMGLREEAFDDLTAAIRLEASADNYAYRALASLRAGQERATRRDLEYSLKLAPARHLATNYMGLLELKQGNTRLACSSFQKGCSSGDCSLLELARKEKLCP